MPVRQMGQYALMYARFQPGYHAARNCLDLSSRAFDICAFAPSPLIRAQNCHCIYVMLPCPYF